METKSKTKSRQARQEQLVLAALGQLSSAMIEHASQMDQGRLAAGSSRLQEALAGLESKQLRALVQHMRSVAGSFDAAARKAELNRGGQHQNPGAYLGVNMPGDSTDRSKRASGGSRILNRQDRSSGSASRWSQRITYGNLEASRRDHPSLDAAIKSLAGSTAGISQ